MIRSALLVLLLTSVAHAGPAERAAPHPAPSAPPAAIEKRRTVGILDVRVDGVADDVRAQFERGLEQQLDTNHYWLSSRSQMRERMKFSTKWTEGCLVGPCLSDVKVQTNAELVLLAALSGSGTSFGYAVTLVRTDTGKVVAQEASRCDVCTVNEAMTEATLTTIRLLNGVPEPLPDEAGDQGAAIDVAVAPVRHQVEVVRRHTSHLGIALTVVGLAAAGAGIAAYYAADQPTYSYVIAGVGGGLTAGGVVVLTF